MAFWWGSGALARILVEERVRRAQEERLLQEALRGRWGKGSRRAGLWGRVRRRIQAAWAQASRRGLLQERDGAPAREKG